MATIQELEILAMDAEDRIQPALTQDEREYWQREAQRCWQAVCDAIEAQS